MDTVLDQRQISHRANFDKKSAVRLLYEDFHRQLFGYCPAGPVLDVGGGTIHRKVFRPDVLSIDVLSFPGIDVVADAQRLPFQDGSFAGVVMLDVLHHIERPLEFLREAARVLKPGGRLVMLEPAMTTVGGWFYTHLHEEPVDMKADPFAPVIPDPNRDPFDANIALPHLLFTTPAARRRVESLVPSLKVHRLDLQSLFAYPMSGGFQSWTLIPGWAVAPMLAVERCLPQWVKRRFAFRLLIVLERT